MSFTDLSVTTLRSAVETLETRLSWSRPELVEHLRSAIAQARNADRKGRPVGSEPQWALHTDLTGALANSSANSGLELHTANVYLVGSDCVGVSARDLAVGLVDSFRDGLQENLDAAREALAEKEAEAQEASSFETRDWDLQYYA